MSFSHDSIEDLGISQRAPESFEKTFLCKFSKFERKKCTKNEASNEQPKEELEIDKIARIIAVKKLKSSETGKKGSDISEIPQKKQIIRWQLPPSKGSGDSKIKSIQDLNPEGNEIKEKESSKPKSKSFEGVDDKIYCFLGDCTHMTKGSNDEENTGRKTFMSLTKNLLIRMGKKAMILKMIIRCLPEIHPDSGLKILWNLFICLCIMVQFFTISIELFFDSKWEKVDRNLEYFAFYMSEILKYSLLLDSIMNLITGYYNQGDLIMDKKKIIRNYFKKLFILDVLVILPIFLDFDESKTGEKQSAFYNSKLSIIKILFIFRILKLQRIFQANDFIISNNEKIEGIISLLKLISKIIFTAHMFACIWYLIGDFSWRNGFPSWKSKVFGEPNPENDWRTYYVHSLYWSLTTMITVGYGDITPMNNFEICFVIISMIFGCGLFGYSLNNIGLIFEKIFAKENQLKTKLGIINRYMKRKNISFQLQGKVRRYLTFIMKESLHESSQHEQELITKLSSTLKKELLLQANGHILTKSPLLTNNFSLKTIQRLTEILEPIDLAPEDYLFEEGETETDRLFFVFEGRLSAFLNCKSDKEAKLKIKSFKEGDVLGEYSFFTGQCREFTVKSIGYTRVYAIHKAKFFEIIQKESNEYETFCRIRDSIILYCDKSLFFTNCVVCGDTDHDINLCKAVNYKPKREEIIKAYQLRKIIRRSKFIRRLQRSSNTLRSLRALSKVKEKLEENYDFDQYETGLNKLRSASNDTLNLQKKNFEKTNSVNEKVPKNISRSQSSQELTNEQHELIITTVEDKSASFLKIPVEPEPFSWSAVPEEIKHELKKSKTDNEKRSKDYLVNRTYSNLTSDKYSSHSKKRKKSFDSVKNYHNQISSLSSSKPSLKKLVTPIPLSKEGAKKHSLIIDANVGASFLNANMLFDMKFDIGTNFKNYFPENNQRTVIRKMKKLEIESEIKSSRFRSDKQIIDVGGVHLSPKKGSSKTSKRLK